MSEPRQLWQRWQRWRKERRMLRGWQRMGPASQLAFFIRMFDATPELREKFRAALRVRGIRSTPRPARRR